MANVYQKGDMVVSAGTVYADPYSTWVAGASGRKVIQWNEDLTLTEEEKKKISEFVAEAEAAPEDRF
jgi:hypothetical protein